MFVFNSRSWLLGAQDELGPSVELHHLRGRRKCRKNEGKRVYFITNDHEFYFFLNVCQFSMLQILAARVRSLCLLDTLKRQFTQN